MTINAMQGSRDCYIMGGGDRYRGLLLLIGQLIVVGSDSSYASHVIRA